jgi:hypothetical protein
LEYEHVDIDEVVVFIDLSDVYNEVYTYSDFEPSFDLNPQDFYKHPPIYSPLQQFIGFLTDHSLTTNLVFRLTSNHTNPEINIIDDGIENWTFDTKLFDQYGQKGLELAAQHIDQLVELLNQHQIYRISIVVYPWPETIRQDSVSSIQVRYWQDFAQLRHLSFVNLFPTFFRPDFDHTKFLVDGEHWNSAGHQIVADSLTNILGISTRSAENLSTN